MKYYFLIALVSCSIRFLSAQTTERDTLNVLVYNLLYFNDGPGCTNVSPNRQDTLRKILTYLKPDIFIATEVTDLAASNLILNTSLNAWGETKYAAAPFVLNGSGSTDDLNQMLYYNSEKLVYHSTTQLETTVRDINRYYLYYKDPDLATTNDTAWVQFYAIHLKAGGTSTDVITRQGECNVIKNDIVANVKSGNIIVCGDFNMDESTEVGYQNLITGSQALRDPANKPGTWNNNGSFASVHTQSTRTTEVFDCGVTGGVDDRFDLFLVSDGIWYGNQYLKYVPGSYKVPGNDGLRFNTSLISGTNTSAPDSVVKALYYMSDHLPVMMKLAWNKDYLALNTEAAAPSVRTVYASAGSLYLSGPSPSQIDFQILSVDGKIIEKGTMQNGNQYMVLGPQYKEGLFVFQYKENEHSFSVPFLMHR
jgi:hypothetical protein